MRDPLLGIPRPRLDHVDNQTGCTLFQAMKMGPGRAFFDTVVLKASFVLAPGRLRWAERQSPVILADEPVDPTRAERSSLRVAGEVLLRKPTTDVLVTGSAFAPGGAPSERWLAGVTVERAGTRVTRSVAEVTGPRHFEHGLLRGWRVSDPRPVTEVPIRYELAYGGAYPQPAAAGGGAPTWRVHPDNPSGRGFLDPDALDRERTYPAPQWQLPGKPVTTIDEDAPVAGFGPIARPWRTRLRYAGTYDDAWFERTYFGARSGLFPDYAPDFDPMFFQCAHPSLICPRTLHGDEDVRLDGLTKEHAALQVRLPGLRIEAELTGRGASTRVPLPLDTVHIDTTEMRVYLCWRLTLPHDAWVKEAVFTHGEELTR